MRANKQKIELAMARECINRKVLAKKSGLPEATVRNVIIGREVRPHTLGAVARVLKADPTDLIEQET